MYAHFTTYPEVGRRLATVSNNLPVVLVVDGDAYVRSSLALLVRSAGWQAETFSTAREFLAHPRPLVPNCLILDVDLPDLSGLELQKLVAAERSDMPFIFVADHGDV